MQLDLPTLMVMQSFAMASAGAVLLIAWLQNRTVSVLAWWGCAHISAAAGILCLMLGFTLHQPAWLGLGGTLLSFQSALIWKATRAINSKSTPFILALIGPVAVGFTGGIPGIREFGGSLALTMGAAYILAAAATLWLGRTERLAARWPLCILAAVHGTALLIGTYSTLTGTTGQDSVPAITSPFGFIYFESIIFALGTAVFILALFKERSEAAGRMAARIDPLSGIANRTGFMETGEKVVERCGRSDLPASVMMFDLDRFKTINDTFGHGVGDDVIRKFCQITAAALRPNDVFGRLGGEEFAVVLPGSSIETAYVRAERICACFAANCRFIGSHRVEATVSCGVSVRSSAEQTLTALLEDADAALYSAKSMGRNRVRRADADQPKPQGGKVTMIRVA
jgi:diguanylate cyclase (GGDEF)-like protein